MLVNIPSVEEIYDLSVDKLTLLHERLISIIKQYEDELNLNPHLEDKELKIKLKQEISLKKARKILNFTETELKSRNYIDDMFDFFLNEDSWKTLYSQYFEDEEFLKNNNPGPQNQMDNALISNTVYRYKQESEASGNLDEIRDITIKEKIGETEYGNMWNKNRKGKKMQIWMSDLLKKTKLDNSEKMIVGASTLPPIKFKNHDLKEAKNINIIRNDIKSQAENCFNPLHKTKTIKLKKDRSIGGLKKSDTNKILPMCSNTKVEKLQIIVGNSEFEKKSEKKKKRIISNEIKMPKNNDLNLKKSETEKILDTKINIFNNRNNTEGEIKLTPRNKPLELDNNSFKKNDVFSKELSSISKVNDEFLNSSCFANPIISITKNNTSPKASIINKNNTEIFEKENTQVETASKNSFSNLIEPSENLICEKDAKNTKINKEKINSEEKSDKAIQLIDSSQIMENHNKLVENEKRRNIDEYSNENEIFSQGKSPLHKNNINQKLKNGIFQSFENSDRRHIAVSVLSDIKVHKNKIEFQEVKGSHDDNISKNPSKDNQQKLCKDKNELINYENRNLAKINNEIFENQHSSNTNCSYLAQLIEKDQYKPRKILNDIDNFLDISDDLMKNSFENNRIISNQDSCMSLTKSKEKFVKEFKRENNKTIEEENSFSQEDEMTVTDKEKQITPNYQEEVEQDKITKDKELKKDNIGKDSKPNSSKIIVTSNTLQMQKTNTHFRKTSDSLFRTTKQTEKRSKSSKIPLYNNIIDKKNMTDYSKYFSSFQEIFSGYYLHSDPKNFDYLNTMRELNNHFKSLLFYEQNDHSEFDKINKYAVEAEVEVIKGRLKRLSDRLLTHNFIYTDEQFIIYKKLVDLEKKEYGRMYNDDDKTNKMFFRVVLSKPEIYDIMCYTLGVKPDWRELPHGNNLGTSWNLLWTYSTPKLEYKNLLAFQKVNHFINNRNLSRKDLLKRSIDRVRKMNNKLNKVFNILPSTYILAKDYVDFAEEFSREKKKNPKENIWIVKPVGKSRGKGIFLISDLTEVPLSDGFLVQKYLTNPLLLDGYKFDMRIYVVVTNFNPLEAFIYEEGFARLSNLPFSNDNIGNRLIHLTNAAIQNKISKKSDTCEKIFGGSKISLELLKQKLSRKGVNFESIWSQTKEIILKSLVACQYDIPYCPSCFELFGYDIIIDSNLKCWLLEINTSPSLERSNVLDDDVKLNLVNDILTLVEPINFDRYALVNVLERRIQQETKVSIKGNYNTYLYSPTIQMNIDLNQILKGYIPRAFGEIPKNCDKFQMLAPTKESDNMIKVSGGQRYFGKMKNVNNPLSNHS